MIGLGHEDLQRMRDALFIEGPDARRRLSRYWLLLPLSAVIASAGVVSDSTATVIGAMIVAPLMTPILGIVLAVVLTDGPNLRRSLLLVVTGAAAVVAVAWVLGFFVPYPVVAATSTQVASRISPRLVDLIAALATGAVGSVALARSDISDTLPGVAIAISLVPPLAVVGLTLESGAPHQALGALLLFATNVIAIVASGILVMGVYRVSGMSPTVDKRSGHHLGAVALVALLLLAVVLPLWINSVHFNRSSVQVTEVQAIANRWAAAAGWSVLGVSNINDNLLIDATGPRPAPSLADLRQDLDDRGIAHGGGAGATAPRSLRPGSEVDGMIWQDHGSVRATPPTTRAQKGKPMTEQEQGSNGATRVAYILGVPLAEHVVRQWPQMGEVVRTRRLVAAVEGNFPELTLEVGRRLRVGDVVVVEWTCDYGDGRLYRNVTIGELEDGEAVRVTDYWGAPTVTPTWRQVMTDRLDMPGDGIWPDSDHLTHH